MLKEYRMQTILGIWGGTFFFAIGYVVIHMREAAYSYFAGAIMCGGFILFICGCFMYSKGKGRSWYFGILGLLGPLGLLVIYALKDRSRMVLKKKQKSIVNGQQTKV